MQCHHCAAATRVLETRVRPDHVVQRKRECANGHRDWTYEVPSTLYRQMAAQAERQAERRASSEWVQDIQRRAGVAADMRKARLAGATCRQLAEQYGISLHMARYYTRLPRHKVYPQKKQACPTSSTPPRNSTRT